MFRFLAATAVVLLIATPDLLADGRKPGSVGVFPVQANTVIDQQCSDSGEGKPCEAALVGVPALTIISVTNTNTMPVGGETLVHFEYVNVVHNPANHFQPLACFVFDRIELLTPADTLSVLTRCHNPGMDNRGYLVVSAQDPTKFNTPWDFDYLIGSELVLNASGSAYSLNMIPFEALVGPGLETDLGGGQGNPPKNGRLDFDGMEYEKLPDVLYIDSFIAALDSHLTLLNLTGGPNAINTVLFSIWNDNEFPLSTTLAFRCWFDEPLPEISPLFTQAFLANNTPDDPAELSLACMPAVNTFETGWAIVQSLDVSEPGGTFIAQDGALLGAISSGPATILDGGRLLWESEAKQDNGSFLEP